MSERSKLLEQACLGFVYLAGEDITEEKAAAVHCFRPAAEEGIREAQYGMAICFTKGFGVAKNPAEAAKWCGRAAAQGYAPAQLSMGLRYLIGDGVGVDWATSMMWHKAAAEQDYPPGVYYLGLCYWGKPADYDPQKAVECLRKAADLGSSEAQWDLGELFLRGVPGVLECDLKEAAKYYEMAAQQHVRRAECRLGECYTLGWGVEQDDEEAARWYKRAAEAGYSVAQLSLGECYRTGRGVPKNSAESKKWLRLANEEKDADCLFLMGSRYRGGDQHEGIGTFEVDGRKAVSFFRRASLRGSRKAMEALAQCYEEGFSVKASKRAAEKWRHRASKIGNKRRADSSGEYGASRKL